MDNQSAVKFSGASRVHMALTVANLERSRTFYETLLGVPSTKVRPGYIRFEPEDPSVNLTLNEVEKVDRTHQPTRHYGVQAKSTQAVQDAISRFTMAGITTAVEENMPCCYAVQDKVRAADPEGNQWGIFVVLDADANDRKDAKSICCATNSREATSKECC
jgi:catechol 2,3-dioxygenase-like lactoylglutathione lyase family enzyme